VRVVGDGPRGPNPFASKASSPVQVAVVDDHALVGRLVVSLLERAGYTAALAFGETAEETWALVEQLVPQFLLLDFGLGPTQSSMDILQRAVAADMLVAGFTASDDPLEHARYLEAGAAAVVSKGCGPADLVAVVELALGGQELMSPADRHAALARLRKYRAAARRELMVFDRLTGRERETLKLIADGHGAGEIAQIWEIAMPTVRSHIHAVLTKLGVTSQLQAAAMARDTGWYGIMEGLSASSILTMADGREAGTIARQSGSTG